MMQNQEKTETKTESLPIEDSRKSRVAINIRNVDPLIRARLKCVCEEHGLSMRAGVLALIEKAIDSKSI